MNSPLPEKPGKIELSLEEKDTRILGPFFLVLTFVFALAMSPIFGATTSWWFSVGCVAFCGIALNPLYLQVKPLQGASLVLDNTGIELLRNGERDFRASWSAISNVRVVDPGFRPKTLRLLDESNRLLGEIPLGQTPLRYQELLALIGRRLPTWVRIEKLVPATRGSLGGKILLATLISGVSIASLLIAFQGMSAVAGSLLQRSASWLLVLGMVGIPFGMMQWNGVLQWRKRERSDRLEPIEPLLKHSALPDVRQLLVGLPVSRKARYAYRPCVIEANKIDPSLQKWASLTSAFGLSVLVGVSVWAMVPTVSLAIVIPLMIVFVAGAAYLPFLFIRKVNAWFAGVREGLDDELLVEHRALWVVRNGRKYPGRLVEDPKYNPRLDTPFGFNRMRIAVEVGDETWWYDPCSMFSEEGLALLEQSHAASPRKLTV